MAYFDFFDNITYNFQNGINKNVKNIFTRPVVNNTLFSDKIEIEDGQSPDQLSISLYEDPDLFYINLLSNNVISNDYWPVSGEEFSDLVSTNFAGYAFHMLEEPAEKPTRGDLFVLKSDFDNFIPDEDDPANETLTYGIVESWDPTYRKMWIKNYSIGLTGAQTTENLFKENNRFYIFKKSIDGSYENDGSQIKAANVSGDDNAFASDPNYPGNSGDEFTMKQVSEYQNSVLRFETLDGLVQLNPYTKNLDIIGDNFSYNITNFAGLTYNSGNTNGSCSLLEGYILSANGQTGSDNRPYTSLQRTVTVIDQITEDNKDLKTIEVLPKQSVGNIIENIKREFDG
tara:strand:+ start:29 stop:1057 length:1029 start_codon:yes stop_codon:yes gene_type:complete